MNNLLNHRTTRCGTIRGSSPDVLRFENSGLLGVLSVDGVLFLPFWCEMIENDADYVRHEGIANHSG